MGLRFMMGPSVRASLTLGSLSMFICTRAFWRAAICSRSLSDRLVLHPLLHVDECLKDLAFVQRQQSDVCGCLCDDEEPVSSTVCCHWTARGGTVSPTTLLVLPFEVTPLRVTVCVLGAISDVKEAFEKAF